MLLEQETQTFAAVHFTILCIVVEDKKKKSDINLKYVINTCNSYSIPYVSKVKYMPRYFAGLTSGCCKGKISEYIVLFLWNNLLF